MILHSLHYHYNQKCFIIMLKELIIIFGSIGNMQKGGYVCKYRRLEWRLDHIFVKGIVRLFVRFFVKRIYFNVIV